MSVLESAGLTDSAQYRALEERVTVLTSVTPRNLTIGAVVAPRIDPILKKLAEVGWEGLDDNDRDILNYAAKYATPGMFDPRNVPNVGSGN